MDSIRGILAFLVGATLVVFGFWHECPRIGAIVIGLLLMGVFTLPEAIEIIRGKTK